LSVRLPFNCSKVAYDSVRRRSQPLSHSDVTLSTTHEAVWNAKYYLAYAFAVIDVLVASVCGLACDYLVRP